MTINVSKGKTQKKIKNQKHCQSGLCDKDRTNLL